MPTQVASVTTRTGLTLRVRRLTGQKATQCRQVALMPYIWVGHRYSVLVGQSWQVRTGAALLAGFAAWRYHSLWPVLPCALLPVAVQKGLQLLDWLISIRHLPDYHRFAEFWETGQNRLYGVFRDSASKESAEADGELVATIASLHVESEVCEMQRLAVLETLRGQGIGDALCRWLMSECAARGYRRMQLGTTHLQSHAIKIYESLGFVRTNQFSSMFLPGVPIYRYEIQLPNSQAS